MPAPSHPPEEVFEEISEVYRAEVEFRLSRTAPATTALRPSTGRSGAAVLLPRFSVMLILFPLFGVAEDFVGFADILELLLGGLIAGVYVRMVFPGELAVGRLDLLVLGRPANPQYLIVVLISGTIHVCALRSKFRYSGIRYSGIQE